MIKLTYQDLNNDQLIPALRKLGQVPGLTMPVAYNISKIIRAVDKEIEIAREGMKTMHGKNDAAHAEIQRIENAEEKQASLKIFMEGVREELKKFMEFEVTIERHLIAKEAVEKAGLSAFELEAVIKICETI
jgi:hypothetical protein